jgi:methyltransferase family protein
MAAIHPDGLDAACGTGRWAVHLSQRGHVVEGVDQSPEMLDVAREKLPGAHFALAAGQSVPANRLHQHGTAGRLHHSVVRGGCVAGYRGPRRANRADMVCPAAAWIACAGGQYASGGPTTARYATRAVRRQAGAATRQCTQEVEEASIIRAIAYPRGLTVCSLVNRVRRLPSCPGGASGFGSP